MYKNCLKRYGLHILAHRNLFNSLQYQEAKDEIEETRAVRYLNCAYRSRLVKNMGIFSSREREFIQTQIFRCHKERHLADRRICHDYRTKRCETDRDIYRDVDSREFTCLVHRAKTNNDRG